MPFWKHNGTILRTLHLNPAFYTIKWEMQKRLEAERQGRELQFAFFMQQCLVWHRFVWHCDERIQIYIHCLLRELGQVPWESRRPLALLRENRKLSR